MLTTDFRRPSNILLIKAIWLIAAIKSLKGNYDIENYVLADHSAGACIAFPVTAVDRDCKGVIGVEGIYDLVELVREYPEYEGFVSNAFGMDRESWKNASPTTIWSKSKFKPYIQLMQSKEDELLSPRQTQLMEAVLREHQYVYLEDTSWIPGNHGEAITTFEFEDRVGNYLCWFLTEVFGMWEGDSDEELPLRERGDSPLWEPIPFEISDLEHSATKTRTSS
jgi:hypothetical protein